MIEMNYIILTASTAESIRLQQTRWIPESRLMTAGSMAHGKLRGIDAADLYYTDGALDALVRSAAFEGKAWSEWRAARSAITGAVRPYEAWEYLHEASQEHLAERNRSRLMVLSDVSHVDADRPTLSHLDLLNFERRHCAAAVRAKAADRLVRIAPRRIIVTEAQYGGVIEIRATWTALPAAQRKAPDWLIDGAQLDTESSRGGVFAL